VMLRSFPGRRFAVTHSMQRWNIYTLNAVGLLSPSVIGCRSIILLTRAYLLMVWKYRTRTTANFGLS
jgi:hypothetical protein